MPTREFDVRLTGWRAAVVMLALLSIPTGVIFGAGFLLGRVT